MPQSLHLKQQGVYDRVSQIDFQVADLPHRRDGNVAVMAHPEHFDVLYQINQHMKVADRPEKRLALSQWENLADLYRQLGLFVNIVKGTAGLPDFVFAANHALVFEDAGYNPWAVLSRMAYPQRMPEIEIASDYLRGLGVSVIDLPDHAAPFESGGDAIWHPGRRLLWLGIGDRTSRHTADFLAETMGIPVLALHHRSPLFYHLDTSFLPLTEDRVMIVREAFDSEGIALIRRMFGSHGVIEAPAKEARDYLVANAHVIRNKHQIHVVMSPDATRTRTLLEDAGIPGLKIQELNLSEFKKSGGAHTCCTMRLPIRH